MSTGPDRNPLHRIIDLLTVYHCALWRVHHAGTGEARLESLNEWYVCHPAVWESSSSRNDTIRRLADPAKAWLSRINCAYVKAEDFDLVEQCAFTLSGFAVSPSPMAMPDVYSKRHTTEDELWQRWTGQGEQVIALGNLIARLRELAARAGEVWTPPTRHPEEGERRRGRKSDTDPRQASVPPAGYPSFDARCPDAKPVQGFVWQGNDGAPSRIDVSVASVAPQAERQAMSTPRTQVFFSYSHKDKKWLQLFQTMLKPVMLADTLWDDTKIKPGAKWKEEIQQALASATVAVLLVSPDFLASDFIAKHELPPLLEAAKQRGLKILWVPVSHSMFQDTEIAGYQAVRDPAQPLDSLHGSKRKQAIVAICETIKTTAQSAGTSNPG